MERISNCDSLLSILQENKRLKKEINYLKRILRENGVMVLPPKDIMDKSHWNI